MDTKKPLTFEDDTSRILFYKHISSIVSNKERDEMKGRVRTKDRCPKCNTAFEEIPLLGYICKKHETVPKKFFIDIFYSGKRLKLYTDNYGQVLDSYDRAVVLLSRINAEMKEKDFDSSQYIKSELSKFYVSTLLDEFLEEKLNGTKPIAPSYRRHYKRYVKMAKKFFGCQDIRELKKRKIIEYHRHINKEYPHFSNKTVKNVINHFEAFMRYAKSMEIINSVPPFPVINFAEPVITTITPETQELLWQNIEDQHKPIFLLMFLAGIRPSETRALRCKSIDIEANLITIIDNFSQGVLRNTRKGIGSKPAIIPIHCEMLPYLKDRVENNLPGAFVFVNEKGEYYKESTLRKIWYRARDKTGIDKNCTLYSASRHTFISDLLENDVSLYDASQLAGHSNIKTTLRYAHSNKKKLKAKVETRSLTGRKVIKLKRKTEES